MRIDLVIALALLAAPAVAQHAQHASQGDARSHAVGMNAKWTEADVDVAQWARRFEDPTRDVIAHREAVVKALQLRPGQSVADVGAGTGAYLATLSRG